MMGTCSGPASRRRGFFCLGPTAGLSAAVGQMTWWLSDELQVLENPFRRLASLEHGGHDEVRTTDHVPSGKHLRVSRLERRVAGGRDTHTPAGVQPDVMLAQPFRWTRQETERDDHRIC